MFERFTEQARQVVVLAQDEARSLEHNYIGTEHLLLGLLRQEEGLTAQALASLDITLEEMRRKVVLVVGRGDEVAAGLIPFTPRAKKVLELALREASSLGHDDVGTAHILLGLARENEGVAARILLDSDADAQTIRNEIIRMLSGPGLHESGAGGPTGEEPKRIVVFWRLARFVAMFGAGVLVGRRSGGTRLARHGPAEALPRSRHGRRRSR